MIAGQVSLRGHPGHRAIRPHFLRSCHECLYTAKNENDL